MSKQILKYGNINIDGIVFGLLDFEIAKTGARVDVADTGANMDLLIGREQIALGVTVISDSEKGIPLRTTNRPITLTLPDRSITGDALIFGLQEVGELDNRVLYRFNIQFDQDAEITELWSIEFDGNDWYAGPVPSLAQINGDWFIWFDYFLPGPSPMPDEVMLWGFGDDLFQGFDWFIVAVELSGTVSPLYVDTTGQFIDGMNLVGAQFGAWNRLVFSKTGSSLIGWLYDGFGNLIDTGTLNWAVDLTYVNRVSVGCGKHAAWSAVEPLPEIIYPVPPGSKIRDAGGAFHEFGQAYTDLGQTTEANINNYIASIENTGPIGGNFEQPNADERGTKRSYF